MDAELDPAVDKWISYTDLPLMVLALASGPLIVLEALGDSTIAAGALTANLVIWALFAVELAIRSFITVRRPSLKYFVSNWFDVAIVFSPFLRPLRILRNARLLRILRSLRIVGFLGRFWQSARRTWHGFAGRLIGLAVLVMMCVPDGLWLTATLAASNASRRSSREGQRAFAGELWLTAELRRPR